MDCGVQKNYVSMLSNAPSPAAANTTPFCSCRRRSCPVSRQSVHPALETVLTSPDVFTSPSRFLTHVNISKCRSILPSKASAKAHPACSTCCNSRRRRTTWRLWTRLFRDPSNHRVVFLKCFEMLGISSSLEGKTWLCWRWSRKLSHGKLSFCLPAASNL